MSVQPIDAIMTLESDEASFEDYTEAMQSLIDSGVVWGLQGWYGRQAQALIEQGICTSSPTGCGAC